MPPPPKADPWFEHECTIRELVSGCARLAKQVGDQELEIRKNREDMIVMRTSFKAIAVVAGAIGSAIGIAAGVLARVMFHS